MGMKTLLLIAEPDFPVSKVCPEHQGFDCPTLGDLDYEDYDSLEHRDAILLDDNAIESKFSTSFLITTVLPLKNENYCSLLKYFFADCCVIHAGADRHYSERRVVQVCEKWQV